MPNTRLDLPLAVAVLALLACNISRAATAPTPTTQSDEGTVLEPASATPTALPDGGTTLEPSSATPTALPDGRTVVEPAPDGQRLFHPDFYWSLTLPSSWEITQDRGFELHARGRGAGENTASLRLLSMVWGTPEERLPTSNAFVEFWRHYEYGDVFPLYANGELVSQTEISAEKAGGPYLLFLFDDPGADARYLQVYASGGGPSSIVLTLWSKRADFEALEPELQAIAESLTAVEAP